MGNSDQRVRGSNRVRSGIEQGLRPSVGLSPVGISLWIPLRWLLLSLQARHVSYRHRISLE